jgi:hypothetical protein
MSRRFYSYALRENTGVHAFLQNSFRRKLDAKGQATENRLCTKKGSPVATGEGKDFRHGPAACIVNEFQQVGVVGVLLVTFNSSAEPDLQN